MTPPKPERDDRRALLGSLPWVGMALVVLVLATAGVRGMASLVLGPVHPPLGDERWAAFEVEAHRVDTVFVGSSRVMRHIDPFVVDDVMAAGGHPTVSFNAGMPAASLLESWHTLEAMLDAGAPIRTVVLEPNDLNVDPENRRTPRVVGLHDPAYLSRHLRNGQRVDRLRQDKRERRARRAQRGRDREPTRDAVEDPWAHTRTAIQAGWLNVSNKGRLARAILPSPHWEPGGGDGRGFRPADAPPLTDVARRNATELARTKKFAAKLRRARRRTQGRRFGDNDVLLDDLRDLLGWLENRGIDVVLLSPPNGLKRDSVYEAWRLHQKGRLPDVPFLVYNHPGDSPKLLDKRMWFDVGHLNAAGARYLSGLFARDLLAVQSGNRP